MPGGFVGKIFLERAPRLWLAVQPIALRGGAAESSYSQSEFRGRDLVPGARCGGVAPGRDLGAAVGSR